MLKILKKDRLEVDKSCVNSTIAHNKRIMILVFENSSNKISHFIMNNASI